MTFTTTPKVQYNLTASHNPDGSITFWVGGQIFTLDAEQVKDLAAYLTKD